MGKNKWNRGKKRPAVKKQPKGTKEPRRIESPESNQQRRIHWHLSSIDSDGPWSVFNIEKGYLLGNLLKKLKSFESMKWGELDPSKSHPMPVNKLCKDARDRLIAIGQDDVDMLFSLRFSSTERMWGIQDRAALKILWWDHSHTVYPTEKKNT